MDNMKDSIKHFLASHPMVGAGSSLGGTILSYLDFVNPVIRTLGSIIMIMIGFVTLLIKIKEYRGMK